MQSRLKQMLGSDLCASIITLRCSFLFQRSPPPSILEKIVPAGLCTVNPDLPSAAGWMQFAVLFHGLAPLRLGLRQRLADIHPAVGTKVSAPADDSQYNLLSQPFGLSGQLGLPLGAQLADVLLELQHHGRGRLRRSRFGRRARRRRLSCFLCYLC